MDDGCQPLRTAHGNHACLHEGSWKEYVCLQGQSLPVETGGKAAGKWMQNRLTEGR